MFTAIQVIDEDTAQRAKTSFYLSKHGYSPSPYASVEEFVQVNRAPSGVVLLAASGQSSDLPDRVRKIISEAPGLPVLIVSHSVSATSAVAAVKAGATDCVDGSSPADLIVVIQKALNEDAYCRGTQAQQQTAIARLDRLSQRERQVLQGLVGGMTNKQIARHLEISPRTVEMHRAHMLSELEAATSSEAIKLAIVAGMAPLADADHVSAIALAPAYAPKRSPRQIKSPQAAPLDTLLPSVVDVLEGTTDCVFLLDREDRFTYFNKAAVETIANGRDLLGANVWSAFPGARETIAFGKLHQAAQERKPLRFEFYEPDLSRWFDVSVRPIPSGLQVFFRDLTKERQAFAELRRSEERLRLALDASGDGAWDLDLRSGHVEMSRRFLEQLHYDHQLVTQSLDWVKSRIHWEDLPLVEQSIEEHLLDRTPSFHAEYRLLNGLGEWRWILDRGRVVDRDIETGQALRIVGTGKDVTELKRQQAEAAEALQRLELAGAGAGAGFWDLNLDDRTVRFCAASLAMHGIDAAPFAPLSEQCWENSVHPEDLPAAKRALEEALVTGAMFRANYRTRSSDGERWILGLARVVQTSPGQPRRMVGLNLQLSSSL
ncbi:PAS domain-containing protein [Sphingomonas tabacisoli]|uniref:histidine kinase n=1 Tax=Sphingomonas tabacisoli TaxID=2249466 RepID=A0ABW4I5D4_9SPHN